MAQPKTYRIITAIGIALLLGIFYLGLHSSDEPEAPPRILSNIPGKWHDPNTDCKLPLPGASKT